MTKRTDTIQKPKSNCLSQRRNIVSAVRLVGAGQTLGRDARCLFIFSFLLLFSSGPLRVMRDRVMRQTGFGKVKGTAFRLESRGHENRDLLRHDRASLSRAHLAHSIRTFSASNTTVIGNELFRPVSRTKETKLPSGRRAGIEYVLTTTLTVRGTIDFGANTKVFSDVPRPSESLY